MTLSHEKTPATGLPYLSAKAVSERVPYCPPTATTPSALATIIAFLACPIPVAITTLM